MDQRLSYEQLIAGKLQSIPVPDMADAIWARVEAQLDIDMPTDDGGSAPQSPPSGPGIIGWGLFVFVVVLISLFLLYKNNFKNSPIQTPSTTNQPLNTPIENTTDPPDQDANDIRRSITADPQTPVDNVNVKQDSIAPNPIIVNTPLRVDSISREITQPPVASSLPRDTTVTDKKKKGVSGISEADYRIVPKKDKQ
jgi:cytoskeletal protein RodZ